MPFIEIENRQIEYRTIPGDGHKPWLVFLHEGLGSVSLWRDFPDKVARRLGCRALIYSRYGYGKSDGISGPRTITFMHDEANTVLPKLCAAFQISAPILIGHSDGASIALIRAADVSANIPALVLMAPHVFVEPVSVASIARITETFETTDLRQRLSRHHERVDDAFMGWSRIWLSPAFRSWSLANEAQRLECPILLIQGTDDEYGTLAQIDAIEQIAKGPTQRVVLSPCGHAPHREQETAVMDAISGFFERYGLI
jgi:pimeloyl-ACP methyl ester carboxylesterase